MHNRNSSEVRAAIHKASSAHGILERKSKHRRKASQHLVHKSMREVKWDLKDLGYSEREVQRAVIVSVLATRPSLATQKFKLKVPFKNFYMYVYLTVARIMAHLHWYLQRRCCGSAGTRISWAPPRGEEDNEGNCDDCQQNCEADESLLFGVATRHVRHNPSGTVRHPNCPLRFCSSRPDGPPVSFELVHHPKRDVVRF